MQILAAAIALLKALPILDSWFRSLALLYVESKLKEHDEEFAVAMVSLKEKHDQRKLELAIGNPNAGQPAIQREGVETRPRKVRQ